MRIFRSISSFNYLLGTSMLALIVAAAIVGFGGRTVSADEVSSRAPSSAERAVNEFLASFSGGTVSPEDHTGEVREFTLEIHQVEREIAPGVPVEQWAFALAGEAPTVPGPELRATQGDLVRITLVNTHEQPHTLHLHGITSVSQQMDGVPHTSHQLLPGESYTYEFVAMKPGTHAYHCHVQTYLHLDMGMYGALIIEPKEEERAWNLDYALILDEWDSAQDPMAAVHAPDNDYFLVNGKAFPGVDPIRIENGDVARVRLINMGYEAHSMHLHGMSFLVVAKDGHELAQPYEGDTLAILPGERYDLLVKGRDGSFPFHDHIVSSVTNAGTYPGGMHLMVEGSPQLRARSGGPQAAGNSGYHHESMSHGHAGGNSHGNSGTNSHGHSGANSHDHSDPAHHGTGGQEDPVAEAALEDVPLLDESELMVDITDFAFDDSVIRIKAGTTVTWTNRDVAPHTVTEGTPGSDPAFDSGMLEQGESWSMTFTEPGEYDYYCLPHPFMTARVIVQPE